MKRETEVTMTRAPTINQKCLAEFLGTFFLVFAGAGTVTASGALLGIHRQVALSSSDMTAVAIAFGFALAVMTYTVGHISGAHFNPAVTIALALKKRIEWNEAWAYIGSQVAGALVAALFIALAFGGGAARTITGYGATDFREPVTGYFSATILEALATFFLMLVIMGTVVSRRVPAAWAGLAIGLTLAGSILVLGTVTGGSLNPARTLGPVIIQLIFGGVYPIGHLFVYIIGPIVGAIAGVYAYEALESPRPTEERREEIKHAVREH